ncbi:hypothetical protein [Mycobacterium shigaense]|uniref:hypothetical protein n=1 Tax=Mycobacterium shigaense TaxID=722731 RepID=UPI003590119A
MQDDKAAGQAEYTDKTEVDETEDEGRADGGQTEKPEPDEEDKKQASEMMVAYEDRPTVVLPGSGGAVSGTAVNDWLDDDGNPKYNNEVDGGGEDGPSDEDKQAQIEKDKALNEELRKAAAEENKGEKRQP